MSFADDVFSIPADVEEFEGDPGRGSDSDSSGEDAESETDTDDEDDGEDEDESDDELKSEGTQNETEINEAAVSDDDHEKECCPVCLNKFIGQDLGTPENCDHVFCLECISEWSKNINTCPVDRAEFNYIHLKSTPTGPVLKKIKVKVRPKEPEETLQESVTLCEVCRRGDREDRLLLCDACDLAYHCECLDPPLFYIPIEEWFCPPCSGILQNGAVAGPSYSRSRRVIPRTRASEVVRSRVQTLRTGNSSVQRSTSRSKSSPRKAPRKRKRRSYKRTFKKVVQLARTQKNVSDGGKGKRCIKGTTVVVSYRRRKKGRRRKRSKISKKAYSSTKALAVPSAKQRIAKLLGICKPPQGLSIPQIKPSSGPRATSRIDNQPSHSLFGFRDQLMDFNENFNEDVPGPSTSISSSIRSSSRVPKEETPTTATSSLNILDSILAGQKILHSKSDDILIKTDGSLVLKEKSHVEKNSVNKPTTISKTTSVLPMHKALVKKSGTYKDQCKSKNQARASDVSSSSLKVNSSGSSRKIRSEYKPSIKNSSLQSHKLKGTSKNDETGMKKFNSSASKSKKPEGLKALKTAQSSKKLHTDVKSVYYKEQEKKLLSPEKNNEYISNTVKNCTRKIKTEKECERFFNTILPTSFSSACISVQSCNDAKVLNFDSINFSSEIKKENMVQKIVESSDSSEKLHEELKPLQELNTVITSSIDRVPIIKKEILSDDDTNMELWDAKSIENPISSIKKEPIESESDEHVIGSHLDSTDELEHSTDNDEDRFIKNSDTVSIKSSNRTVDLKQNVSASSSDNSDDDFVESQSIIEPSNTLNESIHHSQVLNVNSSNVDKSISKASGRKESVSGERKKIQFIKEEPSSDDNDSNELPSTQIFLPNDNLHLTRLTETLDTDKFVSNGNTLFYSDDEIELPATQFLPNNINSSSNSTLDSSSCSIIANSVVSNDLQKQLHNKEKEMKLTDGCKNKKSLLETCIFDKLHIACSNDKQHFDNKMEYCSKEIPATQNALASADCVDVRIVASVQALQSYTQNDDCLPDTKKVCSNEKFSTSTALNSVNNFLITNGASEDQPGDLSDAEVQLHVTQEAFNETEFDLPSTQSSEVEKTSQMLQNSLSLASTNLCEMKSLNSQSSTHSIVNYAPIEENDLMGNNEKEAISSFKSTIISSIMQVVQDLNTNNMSQPVVDSYLEETAQAKQQINNSLHDEDNNSSSASNLSNVTEEEDISTRNKNSELSNKEPNSNDFDISPERLKEILSKSNRSSTPKSICIHKNLPQVIAPSTSKKHIMPKPSRQKTFSFDEVTKLQRPLVQVNENTIMEIKNSKIPAFSDNSCDSDIQINQRLTDSEVFDNPKYIHTIKQEEDIFIEKETSASQRSLVSVIDLCSSDDEISSDFQNLKKTDAAEKPNLTVGKAGQLPSVQRIENEEVKKISTHVFKNKEIQDLPDTQVFKNVEKGKLPKVFRNEKKIVLPTTQVFESEQTIQLPATQVFQNKETIDLPATQMFHNEKTVKFPVTQVDRDFNSETNKNSHESSLNRFSKSKQNKHIVSKENRMNFADYEDLPATQIVKNTSSNHGSCISVLPTTQTTEMFIKKEKKVTQMIGIADLEELPATQMIGNENTFDLPSKKPKLSVEKAGQLSSMQRCENEEARKLPATQLFRNEEIEEIPTHMLENIEIQNLPDTQVCKNSMKELPIPKVFKNGKRITLPTTQLFESEEEMLLPATQVFQSKEEPTTQVARKFITNKKTSCDNSLNRFHKFKQDKHSVSKENGINFAGSEDLPATQIIKNHSTNHGSCISALNKQSSDNNLSKDKKIDKDSMSSNLEELPATQMYMSPLSVELSHHKDLTKEKPCSKQSKNLNIASCGKQSELRLREHKIDMCHDKNRSTCENGSQTKCKSNLNNTVLSSQINKYSRNSTYRGGENFLHISVKKEFFSDDDSLPAIQMSKERNQENLSNGNRSVEISVIKNIKQEIISDEEDLTIENRTTEFQIKNIKKEIVSDHKNSCSGSKSADFIESIKIEVMSDEENCINKNRTAHVLQVQNIKKEISGDGNILCENKSTKLQFVKNVEIGAASNDQKTSKNNYFPDFHSSVKKGNQNDNLQNYNTPNLSTNDKKNSQSNHSQNSKNSDLNMKSSKVQSDCHKVAKHCNSGKSQKREYPNKSIEEHTSKKRKTVQNERNHKQVSECITQQNEHNIKGNSRKQISGKKTVNDILNEIPLDTLAKQNQENIYNLPVSESSESISKHALVTATISKKRPEISSPVYEKNGKKQCVERNVCKSVSHNLQTDLSHKNIGEGECLVLDTMSRRTGRDINCTNTTYKVKVAIDLKSKMHSENKSEHIHTSKQNLNDKDLLKIGKGNCEDLTHKSKDSIKLKGKQDLKEEIAAEIKSVLKPFYNSGLISKDDYKDIMRKAVPKVFVNCGNSINPEKIKKLVLGYVSLLKYS